AAARARSNAARASRAANAAATLAAEAASAADEARTAATQAADLAIAAAQAADDAADHAGEAANAAQEATEHANAASQAAQAAATAALTASDPEAVAYVQGGLQAAAGQDDRGILAQLKITGSANMQKAADAALAGSDADVQHFLQTRDYPGRETEDRIKVNQIMAAARQAGGVAVPDAAQRALDEENDAALRRFLDADQYVAQQNDDRVKVNQILAKGGPELKAQAQAALDGPPALLRKFLQVDQFTAARRDQNTAAHNALVAGLVMQATEMASTAASNAFDAQAAAARARQAASEADGYARQAADAAQQAAGYAQQAAQSANQAENSARDPANSANT